MKLYLIRHGETDYNKMKRNQGQIDIPLNEYGRELAEKTREGLAEVPFDLCLCSPLSRARETAEIILEGRDIPIITDERLIEISFGRYEGRCWNPDTWDEEMPRDLQCFFTEPGLCGIRQEGRTGEFLGLRQSGCALGLSGRPGMRLCFHDKRLCGALLSHAGVLFQKRLADAARRFAHPAHGRGG